MPSLYAFIFAAGAPILDASFAPGPWLERFNYGPLEWLWRCLTYRKVFALRR
jgi:uncharacterized protein